MFEYPEIEIDYALGLLSVEKIQFDHLGAVNGYALDPDFLYEAAFEAIDQICEVTDSGYNDDWNNNILKLVFPGMHSFYALCREQCKRERRSFTNFRHVKDAQNFVYREIGEINDYNIGARLITPKKQTEKKYCCLLIELGCEFYQYVELVETLCNIREYYLDAEKKLRKELYGMSETVKVLRLPAPSSEARRAA